MPQVRAKACPFVKWVGGKRALVPEIAKVLPKQFNEYYEPFVGGGAVFFALKDRINKARLSDLNAELILTYEMIRTKVEELVKLLKRHERAHSAEHYLEVRGDAENKSSLHRAARFIYLNKTCFNGLYRVNKSGKFNVPMGRYSNPKVCDEENLLAVSEALKKVKTRAGSFDEIAPKKGDLVYCDPPYDACFTDYTAGGFGEASQEHLRRCADKWRKKGAHVIVSSSDTPFIRRIWEGYQLKKVLAPRTVSSNGNGRQPVSELLIAG